MLLIQSERNALLAALTSVVGVVERRHTLPILSNLLLEKKAGKLTLLATDLELQISTQLDAQAGEDFAITIAARKLFDIVRALPDSAKVKLDTKDSQVVVSAGKSRFTLQTLPAADFPRVETGSGLGEAIHLPQKKLKRLLQLVQFAMASQDIRYYLNGMLLVLEGKQLRVVATDGHRLSYAETELDMDAGTREVIIPRKTVVELSKLLADVDDAVELRIGANQVTITLPGTELVTKVVDGKFPDYQRVIPLNQPRHLKANRQTVIQALQRAAILSNEKFRGVRLVMSENTLGIVCNNNEQEEAADEIEVSFTGEPLDMGFNVTYLLDGLGAVNSEEITLSLGDANSSMLLTSEGEPGFKYVVMPMRI
ncbi:MAG TPA: DNA polymerase III subunit beta [Thiobacillus sp.]|nr:MAG: DNA polymerase III subunit beta [Hydrogenophilales bacterium 28-61-11]OZA50447.1 MAG: DNA polymerase III subunit beta [Hydrogenophilales bacterium 17-61-76]HQT29627.1 DNA polymerase III subunit beta [Thiobacillus sp.]HQT70237.1 DNA polymerase III subunit beta [Thiobacillus sp.]